MNTRKVYEFQAHANVGAMSANAGDRVATDRVSESTLEDLKTAGVVKLVGQQDYDEKAGEWGPVYVDEKDSAGDPTDTGKDDGKADDQGDEKQADEAQANGEPTGDGQAAGTLVGEAGPELTPPSTPQTGTGKPPKGGR